MTAAEKPLDRLEETRERIQVLDAEQAGIPQKVRTALVEGDEKA